MSIHQIIYSFEIHITYDFRACHFLFTKQNLNKQTDKYQNKVKQYDTNIGLVCSNRAVKYDHCLTAFCKHRSILEESKNDENS